MFKQLAKIGAGTDAMGRGFVSLYHYGNLEGGVIGPLSLGYRTSDLSQYRSLGDLYRFDVPLDVFEAWVERGYAVHGIDQYGTKRIEQIQLIGEASCKIMSFQKSKCP